MARILGLDLGSYSVKGVLVDGTLRGYTVKHYAEVRRAPEGDRMETLRAALGELLARPELKAEQVVVALPGPTLATHPFTLPFTDAKRIEATLPFEVEGQLPFDLGEAVYDYQPVAQKEKATDLLVGVVRKEELAALLALLTERGVDPRIVTHPSVAYQNLFLQLPALFTDVPAEDAVAVVDVGHERTSVAIGRPGAGLEWARTFAGGGKDLDRALAAEFHTSPHEAHHWKEQHGALASAAHTPEQQRAAGAFVRGLQPVLRELRPTLKAFTARTRKRVGAVYLAGGTARLPGLAEQLTHDLGMPVHVLPLPTDAAQAVPAEVGPAALQALALALRGQASGARAPRFNLRRGEFAFKGDYDFVKDRLGLIAAYVATLLLLLVASGIVRNAVLGRREKQVDAQLCEVTQRTLGTCETNYDRALSMMGGVESPAASVPKVSATELLAELTRLIPGDIPVTFDRIQIDTDRVSLQGTTDSSSQIDSIGAALKGHRCFKEVKEGRVERTRDGQKVSFRLDVSVACPEQAVAAEG